MMMMMRNLILGLVFVLVSLININSAFGQQYFFDNETIESWTSDNYFFGTWDDSQYLSVGYKVWDLKSNKGRYTAIITNNDVIAGTITIKYVTYSNASVQPESGMYKHSFDDGDTYTSCIGTQSTGNYGYNFTYTYENSTELTYNYNETKTIHFHDSSNSPEWFIEITFNGTKTDVSTTFNNNTNKDINVYPNPVINTLNVSGLDVNDDVNIYDLNGKLVLNTNEKTGIDVSSLSSGIYIVNGKKIVKR